MKKLKISYSSFKNLYENDRSILNIRKIKDATSRYNYHYDLDEDAIYRSKKEFDRTYGQVSDGTFINIGVVDPYFKIVTDLIMPEKENGKILELVNLARNEYPVFRLFINGLKIPDEVIKIYCTDSFTDIFVPLTLVNSYKTMEIVVESVNFVGNGYINQYYTGVNSNIFTIDLDRTKAELLELNPDKLLIFENGLIIHQEFEASLSEDKKFINVKTENNLTGAVEILYDDSIKYKKKVLENKDIYKLTVDLGEYTEPLFGSVPKKACSFYVNGRKISNKNVNQVGRMHYQISYPDSYSMTYYYVFVRDFGMIDDRLYSVMGSDYYLHKMIGVNRLTFALETGSTQSGLDGFDLNIHHAMNREGKMYDESIIDTRLNYLQGNTDPEFTIEDGIKHEIAENPYILRNFLKNYAKKSRYLVLNKKGKDYFFGSDSKIHDDQQIFYNIFLNRQFLTHDKYTINEEDIITIKDEILNEGTNLLEIEEMVIDNKNRGVRYLQYSTNDLSNVYVNEKKDGLYDADLIINKIAMNGWFEQISDIIILEKEKNNISYLYPSERNVGFIKKDDVDITEEEETVTIHFKTMPKPDFLVYFKNFSYISTIVNNNSSEEDHKNNLIFLYEHGKEHPIPIIPKSIPDLYVNGVLFTYGIDYIYSTPENNTKVAGSLISFTRKINKGDAISLVFSNIENKILVTSINTPYQSKYGLLYLGSLPFPFHVKYCDLFIDGKKVFLSDIDILSDKLIRVNNLAVPFKDIIVKTRFSEDYSLLEPFMEAYKDDHFEITIGNIFQGVDFTRSNPNEGANYDEVYESFENNVGQTNTTKVPNPENEQEEIERTSLLNTIYATWLVSSDARCRINLGENLDKEVLDYFSLYDLSGGSGDRRDIVFDLNETNISGKTIVLDGTKDVIPEHERLRMIIEHMIIKDKMVIGTTELLEKFLKHPVSNIILPYDYPASRDKRRDKYWTFKGTDVLLYHNQSDFKYNPEYLEDNFPNKYKYKGDKNE